MLVLTRRVEQKVVFPNVGITLEVLRVKGNVVKLGIEAPEYVKVLRHEVQQTRQLAQDTLDAEATADVTRKSRAQMHRLRNQVNSAKLAAHLIKQQIDVGMLEGAGESVSTLMDQFSVLEEQLGVMHDKVRSRDVERLEIDRVRQVLIVEPNRNERRLLEGILRMAGLDVLTAGSRAAGLERLAAAEDTVDAVILDPAADDIADAADIDEFRRSGGVRFVYAVTESDPRESDIVDPDLVIDHWFSKPLDPELLVRRVYHDVLEPVSTNGAVNGSTH